MRRLLLLALIGSLAHLSAETTDDGLDLYAPILRAAKVEPINTAPDKIPNTEFYRFYIFRSFEPSVIFTVSFGDPKCQVEYKIVRNFGDLNEDYRVTHSSIINFPRSELRPLLTILDSAEFWKRPTTLSEDFSTDGSTWFIEGVKEGKHHFIERRNPLNRYTDRNYQEGLLIGAFFYLWAQTHQMDGELY